MACLTLFGWSFLAATIVPPWPGRLAGFTEEGIEDGMAAKLSKAFYLFLDISGILGIFLTLLGGWIIAGRSVAPATGVVILLLGVAAIFIHAGHYFNWRITRMLFGSEYFRTGARR